MSTNQINTFTFEGQSTVRTIVKDGEPWFITKDVCHLLGISNNRDALECLEESEKMTVANPDSHSGKRGGARAYACVNESGLYALIFKSRKPEAKRFRKWVTSEVLPAIRKTGKFEAHKQTDADKFLAGIYRNSKDQKEQLDKLFGIVSGLVEAWKTMHAPSKRLKVAESEIQPSILDPSELSPACSIATFIQDACIVNRNAITSIQHLYTAYVAYQIFRNPENKTHTFISFCRMLGGYGFKAIHFGGQMSRVGIALKPDIARLAKVS